MPLNFGYAGLGGETAYGNAVAPAVFVRLQEVPSLEVEHKLAEVPGIVDFGPADVRAAARSGKGDLSIAATPGALGHVLTALMGVPRSVTGTHGANFFHIYTPRAAVPSYTVETRGGTGVKRLVGAKVSELTLSHAVDGLLVAKTAWVGADITVGDEAATPTLETIYFPQWGVAVSFHESPHAARVEDLEVRLSFPKEVHHGLGSAIGVGCEPTGEGDVTVQATLRFFGGSDAEKFTDYIHGAARNVTLYWVAHEEARLMINFTAYITADPSVSQNRDLRTPRIRLSLRAVQAGSPLVTVQLQNHISSYEPETN